MIFFLLHLTQAEVWIWQTSKGWCRPKTFSVGGMELSEFTPPSFVRTVGQGQGLLGRHTANGGNRDCLLLLKQRLGFIIFGRCPD